VKVRIQIREAKNSYQIENLRDVSRVFRHIQGRVIQKFKRWAQRQDWTYPLDLIVSHMRYAWESRKEKEGEIELRRVAVLWNTDEFIPEEDMRRAFKEYKRIWEEILSQVSISWPPDLSFEGLRFKYDRGEAIIKGGTLVIYTFVKVESTA